MVIEYSRNVAGLGKAGSTEFEPDASGPVISTIEEQKKFVEGAGDLGGTMRLGLQPAELPPGSVVAKAYGVDRVEERHRHRYEFNDVYRGQLEAAGLVFSGVNPDLGLVEFVELPADVHPYYVSTQAHPELKSRPTRPHPLFAGLIGAAIDRQRELRIPIDEPACAGSTPRTRATSAELGGWLAPTRRVVSADSAGGWRRLGGWSEFAGPVQSAEHERLRAQLVAGVQADRLVLGGRLRGGQERRVAHGVRVHRPDTTPWLSMPPLRLGSSSR